MADDAKEMVELLDTKIIELKVKYEQYFMKMEKLPPERKREEVDKIIRRHYGKPINNTMLKFKFQTLMS